MKKKVTLKQIAKELDVAVSTVSKALKDSPEISQDTKDKIQAFAKLYNYKPNNIALSLKNRKTKTIGVIIPEIAHNFFSNVINGVEMYANKFGYNVIIGLSNESFDKEVINIETLANGSIDGFILSVAKGTLKKQDFHHLTETINQGMPIVMFDRVVEHIVCDKVIVDDYQGAKNAVNYLIENGSKNIGIITTNDYLNIGKLRTKGYKDALVKNNITIDENLILKVDDETLTENNLFEIEKEIERFFKQNPSLDAVFAVNELYALTAMKVARALQKNIPNEVQVIGFTDGILSRHATPTLTTISQHAQDIGEKSAQLLINRIENDDSEEMFESVIIPTKLIERETTI